MPVLGCFQGRAIARAMCTTVVYHSGGQNPLILPDFLVTLAFEICLVLRGGLPQPIFFNGLGASGTQNFPAGSLGFLARVSYRFALASLNLTNSHERRTRFQKSKTNPLVQKAAPSIS